MLELVVGNITQGLEMGTDFIMASSQAFEWLWVRKGLERLRMFGGRRQAGVRPWDDVLEF
jgi:hypothetical protein